jgi:hypothetical protein
MEKIGAGWRMRQAESMMEDLAWWGYAVMTAHTLCWMLTGSIPNISSKPPSPEHSSLGSCAKVEGIAQKSGPPR